MNNSSNSNDLYRVFLGVGREWAQDKAADQPDFVGVAEIMEGRVCAPRREKRLEPTVQPLSKNEEYLERVLRLGDVVVAARGSGVRAGLVDEEAVGCLPSLNVMLVRFYPHVQDLGPLFVHHLNSQTISDLLKKRHSDRYGRLRLQLDDLRNLITHPGGESVMKLNALLDAWKVHFRSNQIALEKKERLISETISRALTGKPGIERE